MNLSNNGAKLSEFLDYKMQDGSFTNNDLVQFIEQAGMYLNLKTIPKYSKDNNISYNGAKKCRNVVKIFDVKFIIDND